MTDAHGDGNSSLTFESASFGGGLLTSSGVLLYVKDYLGSVRAVLDADNGALYKAVDYSAYGDDSSVSSVPTVSLPSGLTLRAGYTGQEDQQTDFGTGYVDFGARQYSPALRRWLIPDPQSEKSYGTSPYAFCNSNPVNYVDPDGLTPRLYIQKSGLGHAFVTVGDGRNTIIYSYGRYGTVYGSSGITSGRFTPSGEGVLKRLSGLSAVEFLQKVHEEGMFEIYQINPVHDGDVSSYYDSLFENGVYATDPDKESYNNPEARVVDIYHLLGNNCVTMSLKGLNDESIVIDSDAISPIGLDVEMRKLSSTSNQVIRLSNPLEYIEGLLKVIRNEEDLE